MISLIMPVNGKGDNCMKRTISLLMAVLCLVMFSGAAVAEDSATLSPKQSEAVSLMNSIGIFRNVTEEQ